MMRSSPLRLAVVVRAATSLPPPGSLTAKQLTTLQDFREVFAPTHLPGYAWLQELLS